MRVAAAAAVCDRSVPLGMISGEIKDWQLSTSSTYPSDWDRTCHERYARLYQPNGHAWCAKYKTSSEWLQIDLGVAAKVRLLPVPGHLGRGLITGDFVQITEDINQLPNLFISTPRIL